MLSQAQTRDNPRLRSRALSRGEAKREILQMGSIACFRGSITVETNTYAAAHCPETRKNPNSLNGQHSVLSQAQTRDNPRLRSRALSKGEAKREIPEMGSIPCFRGSIIVETNTYAAARSPETRENQNSLNGQYAVLSEAHIRGNSPLRSVLS